MKKKYLICIEFIMLLSLIGNVYQYQMIQQNMNKHSEILIWNEENKENLNDLRVENHNLKSANQSLANALSKYE